MSPASLSVSQSGSSTGRPRLILGVDGGGSKTAALVASVDEPVLGCLTIARQQLTGTGVTNLSGMG